MIPCYFIAALPEFTKEFYEAVEALYNLECYSEIRLPFHATLYFFGEITEVEKFQIEEWMESKEGSYEKISALVKGVGFFTKNNLSSVYYLELESSELSALNTELEIFSNIHKDSFAYLPHISLFSPKLQVAAEDEEKMTKLFSDIEKVEFKGIYFGSVIDNVTRIHKFIKFKEKILNKEQ